MAGIDISTHIVHGKMTTKFLQKLICQWASQRYASYLQLLICRFQPVARTVTGFINVPKALSLILRIQNPELNDAEIQKVIRQKFSYIVGAQLFDRT
jgi:hypothetical protein